MKRGDILRRVDIKIMRPGDGIHPRYLDMIVGKPLRKDLTENQVIPKDAV